MTFNKSQLLVIGTISSSVLGIPDINKVFTEEIIRIAIENPSPTMIIVVSLLKILLVILSFAWLVQLIRNIKFTYDMHNSNTFNLYLATLFLTAVITFVVTMMIRTKFLLP